MSNHLGQLKIPERKRERPAGIVVSQGMTRSRPQIPRTMPKASLETLSIRYDGGAQRIKRRRARKSGFISRTLSYMLIFVMFINPIFVAYADEVVGVEEVPPVAEAVEEVATPEEVSVAPEEPIVEPEVVEEEPVVEVPDESGDALAVPEEPAGDEPTMMEEGGGEDLDEAGSVSETQSETSVEDTSTTDAAADETQQPVQEPSSEENSPTQTAGNEEATETNALDAGVESGAEGATDDTAASEDDETTASTTNETSGEGSGTTTSSTEEEYEAETTAFTTAEGGDTASSTDETEEGAGTDTEEGASTSSGGDSSSSSTGGTSGSTQSGGGVGEYEEDTTTQEDMASSSDDTASSTESDSESGGGTGETGSTDTTGTDGKDESATASTSDETTAATSETSEQEAVPGEGEYTEAVNTVFNADSRYVFGERECTLVADGEFHCIVAGEEEAGTENEIVVGVQVRKDADGDKEIYYRDASGERKITDNIYDDDEPFFDENTGRIAWQSMIDDRWQIMVHNVFTGATIQVTDTRGNNTNVHADGETLVWQGWDNGDWEIYYTQNIHEGQGAVQKLTDNDNHDMFPQVSSNLITWQGASGAGWMVYVHDLYTHKTTEIGENTGGKYENPRFVLLMENRKENGDVETIGYDIASGETIPLGTSSQAPIPNDVPQAPTQEQGQAVPTTSTTTQQKTTKNADDDSPPDEGG